MGGQPTQSLAEGPEEAGQPRLTTGVGSCMCSQEEKLVISTLYLSLS